jgi:hypothetical protein
MTRRRLRTAGLVVVVLVLLIGIRAAITRTSISGYRLVDDYNVALQVTGAHPTWRAVTSETETATDVTIAVSEVGLRIGPGFGDERIGYVIVSLDAPLADRRLVDASTGAVISLIAP